MADFYKRSDVQALLKHRKILFLGDSSVRPLYKDLVSSLKHTGLISVETLKNPNVDSYCGDIAVQQCGRKHEWTFWENRIFEEGSWRVELFCTGRVLTREIQQYLFKLTEVPSSMPDIVYVSFNCSYGKNFWVLVTLKMKLPCNTMVFVGSSFATARDMFGDPRFDEVTFFSRSVVSREEGAEDDIVGKITSLGFHYINIAHFLHKNVFRGMATQPGWEAIVVRYSTFLLLTYISKSLMVKTPGRVNQEVLLKAIASPYDERGYYNSLLLKHANDWLGVKTNVLTEVTDSAGSNAHEVTQMLWKIHNRSRGRGTSAEQKIKYRRHNNKITPIIQSGNCGDTRNPPIESESEFATEPKVTEMNHRSVMYESENCEISRINQDCFLATQEQDLTMENPPSLIENASDSNVKSASHEVAKNIAANSIMGLTPENDDNESLEEGEIRSPITRSPERQTATTHTSLISVLSDISSSGSEDETDANNIPPPTSDRPMFSISSHFSQNYYDQYLNHLELQNYNFQNCQQYPVLHNRPASRYVDCNDPSPSDPLITIEVSDEEATQEETITGENRCNDADEAIINLNSDDSVDNKCSSDEIMTLKPLRVQTKRKERIRKLCLRKTDETLTAWPAGIANSSGPDTVWKWWRNCIEINNNSLELNYQSMPSIRAIIPCLGTKRGSHIAVPKIIDDVRQFLEALAETKFPPMGEGNFLKEVSNTQEVITARRRKLLPLAEELSRGSIKKINFEISHKKKPSPLTTNNRITIKEFASIRNLTVVPTKKLDLNSHNTPEESSCSSFYSYGEQHMEPGLACSSKGEWSPLGPWVPVSSDRNKSSRDLAVVKPRQEKRSSKEQTVHKRRRERSSSSSSDRSRHRDHSPYGPSRHQNIASYGRSQSRELSTSDESYHREPSSPHRHSRRDSRSSRHYSP